MKKIILLMLLLFYFFYLLFYLFSKFNVSLDPVVLQIGVVLAVLGYKAIRAIIK